jgi:2-polyprenyl-3-methyl-5-hydroxy-6-metoxy-1,4-benzoquinol methylase
MVKVYRLNGNPDPPPPATYRMRRAVSTAQQITGLDFNQCALADIGCNRGQLPFYLRELFPRANIYGVDDYLTDAWNNVFNYRGADIAESLPFEDASMDTVFALEVLEHMVDTDRFLDECRRILKPSGWLILSTPNICGWRNRIRVPLGKYPEGLEYKTFVHHVRLYNTPTLRTHLSERGFQSIGITSVQMLPEGAIEHSRPLQRISDALSRAFPTLGMNLMAWAQKPPIILPVSCSAASLPTPTRLSR